MSRDVVVNAQGARSEGEGRRPLSTQGGGAAVRLSEERPRGAVTAASEEEEPTADGARKEAATAVRLS